MIIAHTQKAFLIMGIALIAASFMATPALAGTKYLAGSPNLTISISGTNEFTPGETVGLDVRIQNDGLNQMKMVQSGIVEQDDLPSTAKMVTATLQSGDAPVLIKSDDQMIGDVKGSENAIASFQIRIKDDAKAGMYNLPITIRYTHLAHAEQQGTDSVTYRYQEQMKSLILPLSVKSAINTDIIKVTPEEIHAGGSGYVTLRLKNTGSDVGEKAVAEIIRSGNSPVVPVDGMVYLGTFAPGAEMDAKFKVSVSLDAEPQQYPLKVQVRYENADGEQMTTPEEEIGIPVLKKIAFEVTEHDTIVNPGQSHVIEVPFKNIGESVAYHAQARISAVDPFTSNDDLAYLGDIGPGETSIARFRVTVGSDATVKNYALDSEVRYRDALDTSRISDTIKVPVTVEKPSGPGMLSNLILLVVAFAAIIGGIHLFRTKKQGQRI